jgi:ADP-heptose:LPS heptosyltransferase
VRDPSFSISAEETQTADRLISQHGVGGRKIVAIQPSAGAELKSWPVERWARVGDLLAAAGVDVVLIGGPDDAALLAAVTAKMRSRPRAALHGQSVGVSAATYARCALLIGSDGGGAHLAAAVGTPTVRIYGPAPPHNFGPWPPRDTQQVVMTDRLRCVPCGALENPPCGAERLPACMLAVAENDVLAKARNLLGLT